MLDVATHAEIGADGPTSTVPNDGMFIISNHRATVTGWSFLSRPTDLSGTVNIAGTLTQMNGYYPDLLGRYVTTILFGSAGDYSSGLGIQIARGDNNYSDSRVYLLYNGVAIGRMSSNFQFGASIKFSVSLSTNGAIRGTITGGGNKFDFAFDAHTLDRTNSSIAIIQDHASTVVATLDDVTITSKSGTFFDDFNRPDGEVGNGWRTGFDIFPQVQLFHDNIAVEMLRLADEVYGPNAPLSHAAEDLHDPALDQVSSFAEARQWYAPNLVSDGTGTLQFVMSGGLYRATDTSEWPWLFGGDKPEASALVLAGTVDGKRTLAVIFRGTDQYADWANYPDFQRHYDKFQPLIQAIKTFLHDHTNVEQVLVSGHSLGAGMVEYFSADLATWAAAPDHWFSAFTDGSPGSEVSAPDNAIMNFINTNDLVPILGDVTLGDDILAVLTSVYGGTVATGIAFLIASMRPKPREGASVYIDSDVGSMVSLAEHNSALYVQNTIKLLEFARDIDSPFHTSELAKALIGNLIYRGSPVHIALGRPAGNSNNTSPIDYGDSRYEVEFSASIGIHGDDDYILGNNNSNDVISVTDMGLWLSNANRVFDGGEGTDFLALPLLSTFCEATFDSNSGAYHLSTQLGFEIGALYRIECVVFLDNPVWLGRTATVERPNLFPASSDLFVLNSNPNLPTFFISGEYDYADAGDGDMNVVGTTGRDIIYIGAGNKDVDGGDGDDVITVRQDDTTDILVIDGGAGADLVYGGQGAETYYVNDPGDRIFVPTPGGAHIVVSTVDFVLPDNVQILNLIGSAVFGTGNALNNVVTGNSEANFLTGGLGNDTLSGGGGDDTYVVSENGDVIIEAAGGGIDTVIASNDLGLGSHLENLILAGDTAINGLGNASNNTIAGNAIDNYLSGLAGNDYFDGGLGADTMAGGLGNDTFIVDNTGDICTESNGQGTDTVLASVSYAIGATYIEVLTLTGTANIDAKGNSINNALNGNGGNNRLDGGVGADSLTGDLGDDTYMVDNAGDLVMEKANEGNDTLQTVFTTTLSGNIENLILTETAALNGTGTSGDNSLTGNSGNNQLTGLGGSDALNGGLGTDTMIGGQGSDTYTVDNAGDVVIELNGQGTDMLLSSVSWTLSNASSIETLTLTGPQHINASGNASANVLNGNSGNNTLNGGSGPDTMSGGAGHDIYIVENLGDLVVEGLNAGTDTVQSAVSFVLGDNVENLTLAGSGAINGTGNALANTIYGNAGANFLMGGGGADKLYGRGGNDTYIVDNANMGISELLGGGDAGGVDEVRASVSHSLKDYFENLILTGTGNINGVGNGLANHLTGNSGNNLLTGGGGNDTINGGLGADQFVFGVGSGVDIVSDFSVAQNDRINVHALAHGVVNRAGITFSQVGGDTVINLGGGNMVTIVGAAQSDVLSHMVW